MQLRDMLELQLKFKMLEDNQGRSIIHLLNMQVSKMLIYRIVCCICILVNQFHHGFYALQRICHCKHNW